MIDCIYFINNIEAESHEHIFYEIGIKNKTCATYFRYHLQAVNSRSNASIKYLAGKQRYIIIIYKYHHFCVSISSNIKI